MPVPVLPVSWAILEQAELKTRPAELPRVASRAQQRQLLFRAGARIRWASASELLHRPTDCQDAAAFVAGAIPAFHGKDVPQTVSLFAEEVTDFARFLSRNGSRE